MVEISFGHCFVVVIVVFLFWFGFVCANGVRVLLELHCHACISIDVACVTDVSDCFVHSWLSVSV